MSEGNLRDGDMAVAVPVRVDAGLLFIGTIRTPWAAVADCPRQGDVDSGPLCRIEVADPWRPALGGLVAGGWVDVLYWLRDARRDLVTQHPRGGADARGTFSTRSPHRPNPIGVSAVRIEAVEPAALVVRGLDCRDGTPLVDVKPHLRPLTNA